MLYVLKKNNQFCIDNYLREDFFIRKSLYAIVNTLAH